MVIRMPLRFKNCIEKGLLGKIPASEDNAIRSINKAESWLKEAEKSFQGEAYDSSVLSSYLALRMRKQKKLLNQQGSFCSE
jgi:hypothetical protein